MTTTKRKPHSEEAWAIVVGGNQFGLARTHVCGTDEMVPMTTLHKERAQKYAKGFAAYGDNIGTVRIVRVRITEIVPKRKAKR